jgi:hypothetical protein
MDIYDGAPWTEMDIEDLKAAVEHGYFTMHPSGGYVSFTQAGADLFA